LVLYTSRQILQEDLAVVTCSCMALTTVVTLNVGDFTRFEGQVRVVGLSA